MDYYQNIEMKCSEDTAILRKFVERESIFKFLVGLNIGFNQVQVLGKEDLSFINDVFSIIQANKG